MPGVFVLAAALLLVAAGAAKVRAPGAAAAMLRRAAPWLPRVLRQPAAVRLGGAAEAAVGAAAVVTGGRIALVLLAACYAAFAAVALRLIAVGAGASCGCFGGADSPAGPAHVVLDVLATAAAVAGVVAPPGLFGGRFDGAVLPGLIGIAQAALLAYVGFLSITALPALAADRRRLAA